LKNEHDIYDIGNGELVNIYEYVWDKEVLGVDQRKYGEQLAELFEECDVAGNLPKQKKIKVFPAPRGSPPSRVGVDSLTDQALERGQSASRRAQNGGTRRSRYGREVP
jgi:hypothetical protein